MADSPAAAQAEKYAAWLTPKTALDRLGYRDRGQAILQVYDRLKHGHILAMARNANFRGGKAEYFEISAKTWVSAETGIVTSSLWNTGDVTMLIPIESRAYGYQDNELALFGVRFDPVGIQEILDQTRQAAFTPNAPQKTEPAETEPEKTNGPPVSPELLREWHKLFERTYAGGKGDDLATAYKSAVGMFPGKFVVRQRVRELMGGNRKRGPKPRNEG